MTSNQPTHESSAPQGMTRAELLSLPTSVDLTTANRALGIGRSTGYALARRGAYPCRVLRAGKRFRVVTADLWAVLGVETPPQQAA